LSSAEVSEVLELLKHLDLQGFTPEFVNMLRKDLLPNSSVHPVIYMAELSQKIPARKKITPG
jgi:hypothetical protein